MCCCSVKPQALCGGHGYLPRGAAARSLAKSQTDVVKDQSKAVLGSPLLPVGLLACDLACFSSSQLRSDEDVEQESGINGAKEACVQEPLVITACK